MPGIGVPLASRATTVRGAREGLAHPGVLCPPPPATASEGRHRGRHGGAKTSDTPPIVSVALCAPPATAAETCCTPHRVAGIDRARYRHDGPAVDRIGAVHDRDGTGPLKPVGTTAFEVTATPSGHARLVEEREDVGQRILGLDAQEEGCRNRRSWPAGSALSREEVDRIVYPATTTPPIVSAARTGASSVPLPPISPNSGAFRRRNGGP